MITLMFTKSEIVRHLKARIKLSDLEAERLQAQGAHSNAQKSFAHRDAYQNLLVAIESETVRLEEQTDAVNEEIKSRYPESEF